MSKNQNNKIAIIGSGALSTALGKVLFDSGEKNIIIYGVDKGELESLAIGKNTKYFPETVNLPHFKTTSNISEALDGATHVVLAVPSKLMNIVFENVLNNLNSNVLIINGSKGFYPGLGTSLHEGLMITSKNNQFVRGVVSLIGPSHAEEIVLALPTIVASVDYNKELCEEVQMLFNNDYFKVYVQTDVKGAEVGAAYKNVLAIASGISWGLGYGVNTEAALLTRGLAEMLRFNKAMGGQVETIIGLTGIGDLIVTATSDLSRNFTFGKEFAKNGRVALETNKTVEGLVALDYINSIGKEKGLELPIVYYLYELIHNPDKKDDIIKKLWSRSLKQE